MNIFITGGTSGIGLALAQKYLERGDIVGICGRDLSKVPSNFIERYQERLYLYTVDVKNRAELKQAVADFSAISGLDIMIANAGRSVGTKTVAPNFEMGLEIIDTNIKGVYHSFEAGVEYMLTKKSGHLVAVGSVAGMIGLPGAASYSASKAWVNTLCESLSLDLPKLGINVTCIAPGFIDTPLTQKNDHKMPFMMDAEKAATKIMKAIDGKTALFIFPFPMKAMIYLLDRMPRFCYRFLMKLNCFNYSKDL